MNDKYDKDSLGVDDYENSGIKDTNPNYYIHDILMKLNYALTKENKQEGVMQYVMLVEQLEALLDSVGSGITEEDKKSIDKINKESYGLDDHSEVEQILYLRAKNKMRVLYKKIFESMNDSSAIHM